MRRSLVDQMPPATTTLRQAMRAVLGDNAGYRAAAGLDRSHRAVGDQRRACRSGSAGYRRRRFLRFRPAIARRVERGMERSRLAPGSKARQRLAPDDAGIEARTSPARRSQSS